jgi:hypothetical protein
MLAKHKGARLGLRQSTIRTGFHSITTNLYASLSYTRKLTAFWSKFSRPWSYLITVFGSLCLLIICTCLYVRPDSKARVMAVRRAVLQK